MMSTDKTKPEVLVIDDEMQIRRLLRFTLEDANYVVRESDSGQAGLDEIERSAPAAVILDLGLPDFSGIELLTRLRQRSDVPVLILSVRGEDVTKIAGLDAGADDYLTKPFGDGELLARLRALLRRIRPTVASNIFRFGAVEVEFERRQILKNGRIVKLTAMEYALLIFFLTHRDKALTHRMILRELWGPRAETQTHYLRTYIMRLRRKLEVDVNDPKYFLTESGIGYRFVGDP